jgi:hypothetical protein
MQNVMRRLLPGAAFRCRCHLRVAEANDSTRFGASAEIRWAIQSRETARSRSTDPHPLAQAALLEIRKVAVQGTGRTPSQANENTEKDASKTGKIVNRAGASP